jgi:hypothetical protein
MPISVLAPGMIDELELASHLAEHAPDDGRRSYPSSFDVDRLGVDFRQTTYKEDGGERTPAKLVCPVWSQRTCQRTEGKRMIIDCHGHHTTALREPLEKAGLN